MNTQANIRVLLLGGCLVALSGCASYPISKNLRQQAKPVTLAQVRANPGAVTGTTVIWGGQIINTVNSTNGAAIYVLKLPLDEQGRPKRHAPSTGRFIAQSTEFIEPEVFKKNRLVTIAGRIEGVKTEPLQKIQYTYPVLSIEEAHVWHRRPSYYAYPGWYGPGWGFWPAWDYDWYGPGWGWYGPGWGWGWGWGPDSD